MEETKEMSLLSLVPSVVKLLNLRTIAIYFFIPDGACGSSNGEEKAGKTEGDAGPSCSSLASKAGGDSKSRFFDDSEESEEGEEEEGSDEEVRDYA